jgi:hypothetical protein
MAEPIAFISHFRVKEGRLEQVHSMFAAGATQLEGAKPRTAAFLGYLDEQGAHLTIVHLFPDAAAMDLHFEGAADRSGAAYELFEPEGWEIYGSPSAAAVGIIERDAAKAGVTLTVQPGSLGGFLRLGTSPRSA